MDAIEDITLSEISQAWKHKGCMFKNFSREIWGSQQTEQKE
jgi:hypothetical protein